MLLILSDRSNQLIQLISWTLPVQVPEHPFIKGFKGFSLQAYFRFAVNQGHLFVGMTHDFALNLQGRAGIVDERCGRPSETAKGKRRKTVCFRALMEDTRPNIRRLVQGPRCGHKDVFAPVVFRRMKAGKKLKDGRAGRKVPRACVGVPTTSRSRTR